MKKTTLFTALCFSVQMGFAQPGTLDPAFAEDGISYLNFLSLDEEWMTASVTDAEDRIWVVGQVFQNNDWKLLIVRLNSDGTYDESFADNGHAVVNIGANNIETVGGVAVHDGDLIIAGRTVAGGESSPFLLKYTAQGFLDTEFGEMGMATAPVNMNVSDLHIDESGNIFMSGTADDDIIVVKFLPTGSLDQSFGFFGATFADFPSTDQSVAIDLDEEGNIYVFGYGTLNNITRGQITSFMSNGAVNTDFTPNGRKSITWPDDKGFRVNGGILSEDETQLVLVGRTQDPVTESLNFAMVAVGLNGDQDVNFGNEGWLEIDLSLGGDDLAVDILQGPGGFYVGANIAESPMGINSAVVHMTTGGELIETFAGSGTATVNVMNQSDDQLAALSFQSDGSLIISGVAANQEIGVFGYAARIVTSGTLHTEAPMPLLEAGIYPNPARDVLNVTTPHDRPEALAYTVFDNRGVVVMQGRMRSSLENIDVSTLPAGGYLLHVEGHMPRLWIKID